MIDAPLPFDVMARLNSDFGERADAVAALLLASRLDEYLARCIIYAARGDESKVQHLIEVSRQDYRDVIAPAEYDEIMRRVRDLRVSFLLDGPDTFWVSQVARMMASRGYRLTSLETRPATSGSFEYIADSSEGQAKFMGPKREICIEKRDRQWMIHGNRRDLEIHELDHAFGDEQTFIDAVSGYLLSRISARAINRPDDVPRAQGTGKPRWRFWK